MRQKPILITGGRLVLPDSVLNGDLLIDNGRIAHIIPEGTTSGKQVPSLLLGEYSVIEADDMYILPGMIDIHSDAIEKEIAPRPQAHFPIRPALYELERRVAANGITTMYHSLSLGGESAVGTRRDEAVAEIIDNITVRGRNRSLIRNLVHLRYEVSHLSGIKLVRSLLQERRVHLLSFMDHTPGQGQYTVPGAYEQYAVKTYGFSAEEARSMVDAITAKSKMVDWRQLEEVAMVAYQQGVRVASHDDDTPEKLEAMLKLGVTVSEFPINLKTALYAKAKGLHVVVGAPNVVRDASHGNNLKAIEAIAHGAADTLCSDYYPPAMLAAVFKLVARGMALPSAARMVSQNPAKALGIDQHYGSLEVGKQADLLMVEVYDGHPLVHKTFVGGVPVYQAQYTAQQVNEVILGSCGNG